MYKWLLIPSIVIGVLLLQTFFSSQENAGNPEPANTAIQVQPSPAPVLKNAQRIGLNLGSWTTYGAEQISTNIIQNPGFEGDLDRVIVLVSQSDKTSFYDLKDWGYDDNYWNDATFEVRTGPSAGFTGKIVKSFRAGNNGLPQYNTNPPPPALSPNDVIVLSLQHNTNPVPMWWIGDNMKGKVVVDPTQKRPGSPGIQSLALLPTSSQPAEINFYIDAAAATVGRLLVVKGPWRLSFWMKSDSSNNTMNVLFHRLNQTAPYFEHKIPVTQDWQEYSFDFNGTDTGKPETLQLQFVGNGNGRIWLDDVYLGPVPEPDAFPFRPEVVKLLKELRPSFIRDTQGQLGDTYENRIADIYSRRAVSGRAYAGTRGNSFLYSLKDLLLLCQRVKANPWIVIPPVFSDTEAQALGKYLAQYANKNIFPEVIVEFGNENWNWLFRATGIPYPKQHGEVADKIFRNVLQAAGKEVNIKTVVNGQHVNPSLSLEFLQSTPNADYIAIAPYFFYELNTGTWDLDNLHALFEQDGGFTKETVKGAEKLGKKVSVYEVNLHTTKGNASDPERDSYVDGQAAGSALANRLLQDMLLKVQPQMVFSFTQYHANTEDGIHKVKLWGITRDLSPTDRFRPQGLATIMLNRVIGGDLYALQSSQLLPASQSEALSKTTLAAFKHPNKWTAAAVNGSENPIEIEIAFPDDGIPLPAYMLILSANSPLDTNEDSEKVKIIQQPLQNNGRKTKFTIPAWGFVNLNSGSAEESPPNIPPPSASKIKQPTK